MGVTPRPRLKPVHIAMIRYHWAGLSHDEIARKLNYSAQQVRNIINSDEVQEIIAQLREAALDSIDEVQQDLQLVAPLALQKKIELLDSPDQRVANRASTDLLYMAGHMPIKRYQLEKPSEVSRKYEGMTDEQIAQHLVLSLTQGEALVQSSGGENSSNDNSGPDGKPLN